MARIEGLGDGVAMVVMEVGSLPHEATAKTSTKGMNLAIRIFTTRVALGRTWAHDTATRGAPPSDKGRKHAAGTTGS
jgi:hypothetical protein